MKFFRGREKPKIESGRVESERLQELKEAELEAVKPYPEDTEKLEKEMRKKKKDYEEWKRHFGISAEIQEEREKLEKEYKAKTPEQLKEETKEQVVKYQLERTEQKFDAIIKAKNKERKEAKRKELSPDEIKSLATKFYKDKLGYHLEYGKGIKGFFGFRLEISNKEGKRIIDKETGKPKVLEANMAGLKDREGFIDFLKGELRDKTRKQIEESEKKEKEIPPKEVPEELEKEKPEETEEKEIKEAASFDELHRILEKKGNIKDERREFTPEQLKNAVEYVRNNFKEKPKMINDLKQGLEPGGLRMIPETEGLRDKVKELIVGKEKEEEEPEKPTTEKKPTVEKEEKPTPEEKPTEAAVETPKEEAGESIPEKKVKKIDWLEKGKEDIRKGNIPTQIPNKLEKYLKMHGVRKSEVKRMKPIDAWERAIEIYETEKE